MLSDCLLLVVLHELQVTQFIFLFSICLILVSPTYWLQSPIALLQIVDVSSFFSSLEIKFNAQNVTTISCSQSLRKPSFSVCQKWKLGCSPQTNRILTPNVYMVLSLALTSWSIWLLGKRFWKNLKIRRFSHLIWLRFDPPPKQLSPTFVFAIMLLNCYQNIVEGSFEALVLLYWLQKVSLYIRMREYHTLFHSRLWIAYMESYKLGKSLIASNKLLLHFRQATYKRAAKNSRFQISGTIWAVMFWIFLCTQLLMMFTINIPNKGPCSKRGLRTVQRIKIDWIVTAKGHSYIIYQTSDLEIAELAEERACMANTSTLWLSQPW